MMRIRRDNGHEDQDEDEDEDGNEDEDGHEDEAHLRVRIHR